MSSEEYKESDLSKIVKRLMDEEGFEFGEAVREAMEQTKNFESKADGGSIGIEILFGPKRDNFRYGGDTMGGKNDKSKTSKGPDRSRVSAQQQSNHDRAMAAAQNDSPSFKEKVKSIITNPTVQTLGGAVLSGGLNVLAPKAIQTLNKARMVKKAIDYARYTAPDEAIESELENIQTMGGISPYADGGRVGLFMGGDPLDGQALSIYNSMNAYGFSEQEIANALQEQGLYTPGSTPVVDDPITNTAPNIINQGGGGDGPPKGPTFNRNDLLGTPDYFPAEPFSFKDTISDIGEYIKSGGIIGAGIRGIKNLFSKNTKDYVTTPQLKARDRLEAERKAREEAARQEVERQAAYAQAEKDRITYAALEKSITSGQGDGGRDRPDSGPTATGAGMGVGGGYNTDYGFLKNGGRVGYKDGGLATLLNRRR